MNPKSKKSGTTQSDAADPTAAAEAKAAAETKAAAEAKAAAKAKLSARSNQSAKAKAAAEAKAAAKAKAAAEAEAAAEPKAAAEAKAAVKAKLSARSNQSRLITPGTHGDTALPKVAKGTATIEQFRGATMTCDNDFCLATLEALSDSSFDQHELQATEAEIRRMLRVRCIALFNFYSNASFLQVHEEALRSLDEYCGKETPMPPEKLQSMLRVYGFILTPRMWTRLELVCIMVLLLDPSLCYLSINQKCRSKEEEEFQNRFVVCVFTSRAFLTQ
jgi:flagellar biosynthesis GTPase FlhF